MAKRARRRARTSGKMKAGTCKRVRGVWLCKNRAGRVRFSKTKRY